MSRIIILFSCILLAGFKCEAPQDHSYDDCRFVSKLNITDELNEAFLAYKSNKRNSYRFTRADSTESFSLIGKNVLSPIEKQGRCGACYAFTTAGAIESAIAIKLKKPPVRLSKQQILDCTLTEEYSNLGCRGGSVRSTMLYAKTVGIALEETYPYKGRNNIFCELKPEYNLYKIKAFRAISYRNVGHIMNVINTTGPVVAYISAKILRYDFGTGVYDNDACENEPIDHVVLLVGYGTDAQSGKDYWIVRNTWGTDWAENGYGRIRRGKNTCNIESLLYYPLV